MFSNMAVDKDETIIFLGEYSILWQALALHRMKILKNKQVHLYLSDHFTKKVEDNLKAFKWGQKPCGTPMVMESLLTNINKNDYINIGSVATAINSAIDILKKENTIKVYEVESIDSLEIKNDQLYINFTITTTNVRHHRLETNAHDINNSNKRTCNNIYKKYDNVFIFNTLMEPRINNNVLWSNFLDVKVMYEQYSKYKGESLKFVFGNGPSSVWMKALFKDEEVYYICTGNPYDIYIKYASNPRNKTIVTKILENDKYFLSPNNHSITNAEDIDNLNENSAELIEIERNFCIKEQLRNLLKDKKYFTDMPRNRISVILNKDKTAVIHVGLGINAVGYKENLTILNNLSTEYKNKNVFNLQITNIKDEIEKHTVAPQEIHGSVLHSIDWQIVSKFSDFFHLSIEQRMLLVPIERLFFRMKEHKTIIQQYMEEQGVKVADSFFNDLKNLIKSKEYVQINLDESINAIVEIFNNSETNNQIREQFKAMLYKLNENKKEIFLDQKTNPFLIQFKKYKNDAIRLIEENPKKTAAAAVVVSGAALSYFSYKDKCVIS